MNKRTKVDTLEKWHREEARVQAGEWCDVRMCVCVCVRAQKATCTLQWDEEKLQQLPRIAAGKKKKSSWKFQSQFQCILRFSFTHSAYFPFLSAFPSPLLSPSLSLSFYLRLTHSCIDTSPPRLNSLLPLSDSTSLSRRLPVHCLSFLLHYFSRKELTASQSRLLLAKVFSPPIKNGWTCSTSVLFSCIKLVKRVKWE